MATFRVGQRVRVVRCIESNNLVPGDAHIPQAVGKEATVISELYFDIRYAEHCYRIKIDGIDEPPGHFTTALPDELEPIQPSGNRVVAWSECLWQPEEMREGVT